ncbi:MAG: DUF896 domain-containing protein [Oscillospiraceae bacterium]|nr:DUF896 domain-containing protein [Oscillospiraceae bacterium]
MEKKLIDRINELAHKAKTVGLTEEELAERETLRNEYRAAFRRSLVGTLEHTVIVDQEGHVIRRVADAHKETQE